MIWKGAAVAVAFMACAALAGAAHVNMHEQTILIDEVSSSTVTVYFGPIQGYVTAWQYVHDDFTAGFDATLETATTGVLLRSFSDHLAASDLGLITPGLMYATDATVFALGHKGALGFWPVDNERIKLEITNCVSQTTAVFRIWSEGAR